MAEVTKEIEKEETRRFIQAQRKEILMELKSIFSDQKLVHKQPIFGLSRGISEVIY